MAKGKPPARRTRLKMYTAYVDYPHITWAGWRAYEGFPGSSGFVIDRIAFPLTATSIGHAKTLAEKAWGRNGTARIQVRYIGSCVEPAV